MSSQNGEKADLEDWEKWAVDFEKDLDTLLLNAFSNGGMRKSSMDKIKAQVMCTLYEDKYNFKGIRKEASS